MTIKSFKCKDTEALFIGQRVHRWVNTAFQNSRDCFNGTGFWMLLGLGCLLWVRFTKVTFTVFSTVRGAVWVIQDGHDHDRIVEEIRERQRARFLSLYGGIHLEHGVENEVGKFRWLAEQQVLTPEEAEKHIARVHAASIAAGGSTPVTLN